ncbi:hypothetical protein EMEDMD4_310152 [Sinorhizobium medicae]|uniref:Uncharacterized protein n=1 Tax=Sinorhizobium medicae TaxID=110321 RepID=A0A508WWS9_9HYPH|nr:hypothetical protein EMEDMD4_310152 [Sinorhizobium medicae]
MLVVNCKNHVSLSWKKANYNFRSYSNYNSVLSC